MRARKLESESEVQKGQIEQKKRIETTRERNE